VNRIELLVLGALAASPEGLTAEALAGIAETEVRPTLDALGGRVRRHGSRYRLTPEGLEALLRLHAELERAVDPSAPRPGDQGAQSIPWLTTVRTCWVDALSFNYAVPRDALARLLPGPLEPEAWKGSAWVQVLVSSLRDLRPQGMPSLFGNNFCQVSYRAAVRYRSADGEWRRGGFFTRSDTNDAVMRAVGNRLSEFRFHDFGAVTATMLREGENLIVGIEPEAARPGGALVAVVPTVALPGPPPGSAWTSLAELHEPLVECYDAFGVDEAKGFVYVLTIDRDPWNPVFVEPRQIYSEYFDTGPLGACGARLDSVLHIRECEYRWRPLRRERLAREGP
jgi:uncharacterized protein YqjF (DUF2071 family)